jgi:hypothetical protein
MSFRQICSWYPLTPEELQHDKLSVEKIRALVITLALSSRGLLNQKPELLEGWSVPQARPS